MNAFKINVKVLDAICTYASPKYITGANLQEPMTIFGKLITMTMEVHKTP